MSLRSPSPSLVSSFPSLSTVQSNKGSIHVIFGPMFSGKSTELLRQMKRYIEHIFLLLSLPCFIAFFHFHFPFFFFLLSVTILFPLDILLLSEIVY